MDGNAIGPPSGRLCETGSWYHLPMALDPFARLEAARDLLDAGRPDRAAVTLAAAFPSALAGESFFLRAEALRAQG